MTNRQLIAALSEIPEALLDAEALVEVEKDGRSRRAPLNRVHQSGGVVTIIGTDFYSAPSFNRVFLGVGHVPGSNRLPTPLLLGLWGRP